MRFVEVFKAITRNWLRSRSGLFFSFVFPVFFLLIFGSILGGTGNSIPLSVQNRDLSGSAPTPLSQAFIAELNSTHVLKISEVPPSANITAYVQGQASSFGGDPRVLVIPEGFASNLTKGVAVKLTYVASPGDQLGAQVGGVIASVMNAFNFGISNPPQPQLVTLTTVSSSVRVYSQVDYYMPGLIAAFMMTNGVIGLTSIAAEFRRTGLTKRLSATPLTKLEWLVGNILSQAVLALILATVMILLGIGIYGISVTIDGYVVLAMILGAILFSGIGMVLAGLVKDAEAASGLGNAIAFPMMFLSGTFFPVSIMPLWLQSVARVLPLTYFSESLRDAMIVGNVSAALVNIGVTGALALAFILIGARVTRWKEA